MPGVPRTDLRAEPSSPSRVRGAVVGGAFRAVGSATGALRDVAQDLLARRSTPRRLPGRLTGLLRLLVVVLLAEIAWLRSLTSDTLTCASGRVCQIATLDGREEQLLPVAVAAVAVLLPVALWTRGFARARPFSLLLIVAGTLLALVGASGVLAVLTVGAAIAAAGVALLAWLLLSLVGG